MQKSARILGMIWIAVVTAAGLILWAKYASVAENVFQMRLAYGLIALVFFAMLPGYLIFRWGKGPYVKQANTAAEALRPKAPFNRALEEGHVMRFGNDQDA